MVFVIIAVKKVNFTGVDTTFFSILSFLGVYFSLKEMQSPRITVSLVPC